MVTDSEVGRNKLPFVYSCKVPSSTDKNGIFKYAWLTLLIVSPIACVCSALQTASEWPASLSKLGGGEVPVWEDFLIVGLVWSWQKFVYTGYIFHSRGLCWRHFDGFSWWLTAFDYDSNFIWLDCFSLLFRFFHQSSFLSSESPVEQQSIVGEPFSTFVVAIPMVVIGPSW